MADPGGPATLRYDNPDRDSRLEYVDGIGDRVAFIEVNDRLFGPGGWKLWYAPPGEKPVEVDKGAGGELPFFGISEEYLVWAVVSGTPPTSELRLLDLSSMNRRVLESAAADRVQYWFPDIAGSRVVYGTVEPSADLSSDERHIYLLDLASSEPSRRLDSSKSASEPTIDGDDVVWKESDPDLNFLVAGDLVHYSIATGTVTPLAMPGAKGTGFTDPTIGHGMVAAWPDSDRGLFLADLRSGEYVPVLDLGAATSDPHDGVGHPDISDDLLTYLYQPSTGDLEFRWVRLR